LLSMDAFRRAMEAGNMDKAYGMVVGTILLFPWLVVAVMAVGAVWSKVRAFAQFQVSCQVRTPSLRCRQTNSLPRV